MMTNKYKIGDIVRVIANKNHDEIPECDKTINMVGVVLGIDEDEKDEAGYILNIRMYEDDKEPSFSGDKDECMVFFEEELEPVLIDNIFVNER